MQLFHKGDFKNFTIILLSLKYFTARSYNQRVEKNVLVNQFSRQSRWKLIPRWEPRSLQAFVCSQFVSFLLDAWKIVPHQSCNDSARGTKPAFRSAILLAHFAHSTLSFADTRRIHTLESQLVTYNEYCSKNCISCALRRSKFLPMDV